MATPTLIYCADGNPRFAEIAIAAGFQYGARLPGVVHFPIQFADQDWKQPDLATYLVALRQHRPQRATVLDWERLEQLSEVLAWAEEVAAIVEETVIIIPKVQGGIARLPRRVGGREIRLGYSVPTRYGGTELPLWDFSGWPIHLLGGSPGRQLELAQYLNVVSADGNMALGMANGSKARAVCFWRPGKKPFSNNWPTIEQADGCRWPSTDAMYEAFRRSCQNIMAAWQGKPPTGGD